MEYVLLEIQTELTDLNKVMQVATIYRSPNSSIENKISNITQKVIIQRTFITIKFTYFEIQTITWRHDRGIQNYT